MEAIVGVWMSSLVGAAAFCAAGYVLGQRGVIVPLHQPAPQPTPALPPVIFEATPTAPPAALEPSPSIAPISSRPTVAPPDPLLSEEQRPTPVPAAPSAELLEALARLDAEAQRARAAETLKTEAERQLEALRGELRHELVARANAEARSEELGDRLAKASEEAATLRHQVTLLDRQARQLRDALQGRVRALTSSEWHHRRDLEETEALRVKLNEAYDRIERSSMPPPEMPRSLPPRSVSTEPPISGRNEDPVALKKEIVRLTQENRSLRARALGSLPPKPSRNSAPEIDLAKYQSLVERIGTIAGLRGAAICDELGSLLVGSGEFAESLAAFGAYIRDASSRTDRLLPLDGVDEIDIRDRAGVHLMSRVVTRAPTELSLVILGAAEASIAAAKQVVADARITL